MSAKDVFHFVVKNALIKEGWIITDDPLFIGFGGIDLYVDLGAEKIIAAHKDGIKIAVEIKSFVGVSLISEFHRALGQYINYREALKIEEPERKLYLAVPSDIYSNFFSLELIKLVTVSNKLCLIIYNVGEEIIVKWQD
ncbi:MAG: XisH family protein [Desulfobacterales bacterium]|nr:XisH family protein [Desulfobacterales bacterium]